MTILECVPNFSEGRDKQVLARIANCFRGIKGIKLLGYESDYDHNRSVFTVAGEPKTLANAMIDAVGVAVELIDLTKHSGHHPRIGAVDVIPFVPVKNVTINQAKKIAEYVSETIWQRYGLPVYLYEKSAKAPSRCNLATIRQGGFEGLADKMLLAEWAPDYGETKPHNTAGAAVVGVREFLIAYNINLDSEDITAARAIASKIRFSNGGLEHCKALGIMLNTRNIAQVSINLTDFNVTDMYDVYSAVAKEAEKYGVKILSSEIVGLVPSKALSMAAAKFLKIENFSMDKVLEYKLEN